LDGGREGETHFNSGGKGRGRRRGRGGDLLHAVEIGKRKTDHVTLEGKVRKKAIAIHSIRHAAERGEERGEYLGGALKSGEPCRERADP